MSDERGESRGKSEGSTGVRGVTCGGGHDHLQARAPLQQILQQVLRERHQHAQRVLRRRLRRVALLLRLLPRPQLEHRLQVLGRRRWRSDGRRRWEER